MHWALNTDAPTPLSGLKAALEKAQAEFLATNTPTRQAAGPNNTINVLVDAPALEAMMSRMEAGIAAAMILATARGDAHPFHATVHGAYTPGSGEIPAYSVDEAAGVSIAQIVAKIQAAPAKATTPSAPASTPPPSAPVSAASLPTVPPPAPAKKKAS